MRTGDEKKGRQERKERNTGTDNNKQKKSDAHQPQKKGRQSTLKVRQQMVKRAINRKQEKERQGRKGRLAMNKA